MKNWTIKNKYLLLASVILGLIVGICVNYSVLSSPIEVGVDFPISFHTKLSNITSSEDYWKGTIDTELKQMSAKMSELVMKVEALNCGLTEVRVNAAKEGGFYGLLVSIIVTLGSILGQGIWRARKKNGTEKNRKS